MRFLYLNVLLTMIILTSGCASNKLGNHSFPLLSKAWNGSKAALRTSRAALGKVCPKNRLIASRIARPVQTAGQCGCDHCSTMRLEGIPSIEYQQQPIEQQPIGQTHGCQDGSCSLQHLDSQAATAEVFYGVPQYADGSEQVIPQQFFPQQGIAFTEAPPENSIPIEPASPVGVPNINVDQSEFDNPAGILETSPSVEPETDDQSVFDLAPGLEEPENEAVPYVEPSLITAPPEPGGSSAPQLDGDTGFLAPQRLMDTQGDLAEEESDDFDSVLGPTEAQAEQKNILESRRRDQKTTQIVLKARPVLNHRVNNQSILQPNSTLTSNRTDDYGLPVDRSVHFNELPPMDAGTRPRPVSFERNEIALPPVERIERAEEVGDKTTQLEKNGMQVVESTTNVPTDVEPMLRMTAVPYAGQSSLGAAIARIKVGKTPLIVRGAYPRDVEYERLARERNEQATRSIIIPNSSLKTIDR